jgi:hypothetical protein|tara:strand:+ start:733 stop:930 length:198 start_codon:yes stop_codon:yes gene_type:complete
MKKEKKILDPSFCFRSWIERKPVYQENRERKKEREMKTINPILREERSKNGKKKLQRHSINASRQ